MELIEFASVDPDAGREDLRPLLAMVGDARVVGLGACVPGSSETHRMKHRIVELLAEEAGFTTFVLEANLAETIRVNEYVLEGRGEPSELLGRHLYWGVNTGEMAALLEWMRAFNTSGRGRILIAGCDVQRVDTATEIVKEQLGEIDPELAASVARRYERVLEADRAHWLTGKGIQAWFPVEEARGRRLRFSGFIRTESVSDHACIWGWAGGAEGTLCQDALEGRRPRGTTGWREYAIDLDVPEAAKHVSLGCFLAGNGRAWFDGLAIEIDGTPWRDPGRIDLDLSSVTLRGFWVDPRNRAIRDPDVTFTGQPSLRIEPAGPVPEFETGDLEALAIAEQVVTDIEESAPPDRARRALRCARGVVQALEMRRGGGDVARARSMAENIEWLLRRRDETRIVFSSLNSRVARGGGDTGGFLARSLGADYVPLGFAIGEGECLTLAARRQEGISRHRLDPPPPWSVEGRLARTGRPRLILDLRTVEPADPEWGWLDEALPFRDVGPAALTHEFFERRVREDFDLLLWLRETTAARSLA